MQRIQPQNLMTLKSDARVLDFGVAALLDPSGERFTRSSDAVAGDAFSAPELTDNPRHIDPRCDIYSLGACWYWLLTGTSPKGLNWESKLRASVNIAPAYERVLLRCLDQPDRRYSAATELLADVRALERGDVPAQSPHDLTDDQARVLGVIVGACPTKSDTVSFYGLEQEIGRRQSRLRTSLALRGLLARQMIDEQTVTNDFGGEATVYLPESAGATWVERNLSRVEELLQPLEAPQVSGADEIPF